MFGFGGTPKTHGQLAKDEFGVGVDHMLQAAQHAAGGVGSAVGPRVHSMRSMVTPAAGRVRTVASSGWDSTVSSLAPIMAAAREGAREATEAAIKAKAKADKARQKEGHVKQRRIGLALGLLAAGVAVGAAAALVVRRRRRNAWEDYDPSDALESMMDTVGSRASDVKDKANELTDKAKDAAGDMKDKASDLTRKAGDSVQKAADKTGDAVQKAADKSNNTVQKADKAGDRYADTGDRMR